MKKYAILVSLLLALTLLLTACVGVVQPLGTAAPETKAPETKAPETNAPETNAPETKTPETDAPETEAPEAPSEVRWEDIGTKGTVGTVLPDFTVETIDGETFTLSEVLKDHDLVLINLWATWCPPCRGEFPYLQEAWEARKDRVAVLALTVEETDTPEVLRDFAAEYGLSFPIGKDESYRFTMAFNVSAIPTSLLVDRSRTVIWTEVGAMPSVQAFLDLFDEYLQTAAKAPSNAGRLGR